MDSLKKRLNGIIEFLSKHSDTIGYILLSLLFIYIHVRIWNNLEACIESDMSSELVLAKIMAQEKRIITTSWFYATELKVLHNTLLFAFLFLFTNDWHLVRIISIVVLNIVLLLSFYYLAKKLKMKHIPWIAFMILGSTSRDYYKFVTLGSHYIPDLAISFVTIGLIISIFEDTNKTKRIIKSVLLMALSFTASLSGSRFLAVLHLPLLISAVLYCLYKQFDLLKEGKFVFKDESVDLILFCGVMLVVSYVGLYFNSHILPNMGYAYKLDGTNISYVEFTFSNLGKILNGWLSVFGYQYDNAMVLSIPQLLLKPLFAAYFLISLWSTIDILLNFKKYNKFELLTTIFYAVGILIMSVLYTFTDMWYRNRYLLSVSVFSAYVIGIFFTHFRINWQKSILIGCIVLFTLVNTPFQIDYHLQNDSYIELATVRDILLENECYNGYSANHWNGNNILTELSDGKIETWYGTPTNVKSYQQAKNHKTRTPEGKVYALVLKSEANGITFNDDSTKYLKYEDNTRWLYIFDSYDQMREVMIWE